MQPTFAGSKEYHIVAYRVFYVLNINIHFILQILSAECVKLIINVYNSWNKMLIDLPIVCLVHVLSFLDPLSRWYFSLTCRKMVETYQKKNVQFFFKSNTFAFERYGIVWKGHYPALNFKTHEMHPISFFYDSLQHGFSWKLEPISDMIKYQRTIHEYFLGNLICSRTIINKHEQHITIYNENGTTITFTWSNAIWPIFHHLDYKLFQQYPFLY